METEVHVIGSNATGLEIEFADGLHTIPGSIVIFLGGIDKITELAPQLRGQHSESFFEAVGKLRTSAFLNNFQTGIIEGHFAKNIY